MVQRRGCSGVTSPTTKKVRRLVQLSCLVVSGLGRSFLLVKQAVRSVSIFEMNTPRLETDTFTIPLQERGYNLYYFTLDLNNESHRPELAIQTATSANLWHQRLAHLNRNSLDLLKNLDNTGVSFDGTVPTCGACAVGRLTSLLTRRRLITKASSLSSWFIFEGALMAGILEGGIIQGGASPKGAPQKGVLEHLEHPISPGGAIIAGCIIAAPTEAAFAPGSDACGYACWYCSKIIRQA